MESVRIGVIGVGQIGKSHLSHYSKFEGPEIVAVADVNGEEARRVAGEYGIEHVFTDFRELLRRDDIRAVDVCLHNNLHAPVTIAALEAGKHVYCEKPMAGSYADAKAMLDRARALDRKLSIQLASLYTKETRAAKRLIEEGHLGQPYHARSTGYRRRGRPYVDGYGSPTFVNGEISAGGALYDMGVYHIAQILYLLGVPEVERVSGKTYQKTDMDPERREKSGYNVEELGLGFVRLAGDVTLDLIESWAIHLDPHEGSYVVGTDGGVRLQPFGFYRTLADMEMNATFNLDAYESRRHSLRADADAYDSAQRHWIAALQGRVPLLPTAEIALATMLISEGIYLSSRLGREVTAEEVREQSRSTALAL
jgi:predicted dehydrogenase